MSKDGLDIENDNYLGHRVLAPPLKYNTVSPVISPDGTEVAFFSVNEDGVIIVKAPLLRGKQIFDSKGKLNIGYDKDKDFEVLFKSFPPVPYEYLISQDFGTWPFNGSDLDWSKDDKLAFFAKKGKDHILVLLDIKTKKRQEFELQLDQAFSPAFSPDGKTVYFSASKNTIRDIYSINIENGYVQNITADDAFDTAPAVSFDGTKIVYASFIKDFQKLFVLDLFTGKKQQLTFNRYNDSSPSFSDDGKFVTYVSDEIARDISGKENQEDRVWNLYTINLEDRAVSQWTDSSAGVSTPRFARSMDDRVVLASWSDRQFGGTQFPVDMLYELQLKKPIRTFVMKDENQIMDWTFRTNELFQFEPDDNQINNKDNFRNNWRMRAYGVDVGYNTYWGMWGSSGFEISDILEEHKYNFLVGLYGQVRFINFDHLNLERRMYWGYNVSNQVLPLYFVNYDILKGNPNQPVLNNTWINSTETSFSLAYPIDKFNRFEFSTGLDNKSFRLYGVPSREAVDLLSQQGGVSPSDMAFATFFRDSEGVRLKFRSSYVRDTVISSYGVQGPYNGNVFRTDFEVAPSMFSRADSSISLSVDARRYMRLGSSSLLALRATAIANTSANGKFIVIGGNDTLRGYPYGSQVGNEVLYSSAELRFPLIENIVLPGNMALGSIRGLAFMDYGLTKFNNSNLPATGGKSYGLGFQFFSILPLNFVWANTPNEKWKYDVYISYNW